jgi:hypothetical protein
MFWSGIAIVNLLAEPLAIVVFDIFVAIPFQT